MTTRHSLRSRNLIRQKMVNDMAEFLADATNNQTEINLAEVTEMRRRLHHAFAIDNQKSFMDYS